jgi:hypothetical protein
MMMVHIRFGSATPNIIYWRKNVSGESLAFIINISGKKKKGEAEKLPDKL